MKKIEKFERSRLTEVHRPIVQHYWRVSREMDIKDSAKREITELQIEGGRSKMADAECEVHLAMHAPDGGYHDGYERMVKGRPVGGQQTRFVLLQGMVAIFYYLNGMPGRLFVG